MEDEKVMLEAACKIQGCKKKDVLAWRVNDAGQVVLIVGPAGQKFVVDVPQPEQPVSDAAVAGPVPDFAERVPKRLWVILEKHGLTDPETLRGMADEELLQVDGIGAGTLRQLRELLG